MKEIRTSALSSTTKEKEKERKNEHSEYNYNRKTGLNLKNTNNGKISLIVLERCIFYMKIIKLRNLSQN